MTPMPPGTLHPSVSPTTLNKLLDLADLQTYADEARIVARRWVGEQASEWRQWEYTIALVAMRQWQQAHPAAPRLPRVFDVGGAGSRFYLMVGDALGTLPQVIDPSGGGELLGDFLRRTGETADLVTCLSVLEHVPDLDQFCWELANAVTPGGRLILTMDFGATINDTYHFHWMRERIFCEQTVIALAETFKQWGFSSEPARWRPFIPRVYDYVFSSLILDKRR